MKKNLSYLLLTVLFAGTVCFAWGQQAFAAKYELKLAHSNPEKDYSHLHSPLAVFKAEVERRTGGEVTVTLYPNGTLGTQKAMLEQTIRGMIQGVSISEGGIAPFFPEIAALSIPYLFREVNVAYEVLDGPLGDYLKDEMAAKTGLRPLAWGEDAGFRHFSSSKREIRTPADLKGMKIRTMPIPAHLEMVKALGGNPTPVSWSELYTALQTAVAEGQENPICNIRIARLYEVQKYLTLDGHLYSFISIFVNDKWLQSLPPQHRQAVIESGRIAAMLTRSLSRVNESLDLEFLKENGMQVYAPTPEEKALFKEAAQAPVIKLLKESLDPALIDRVLEETAKAEKKLGYSQ